jgi:hypothetical protein
LVDVVESKKLRCRLLHTPAGSALGRSATSQGSRPVALDMTTDLYYSHVMSTALREAADAMDRVFIQPN